VSDCLQRALDFAVAREKEAELVYKQWEQRAPTARLKSLLAELGAAERGHHEMLLHISPDEVVPRRAKSDAAVGITRLLADVACPSGPLSREAVALAIRREEALVALYKFLADLGGETAQLFRALAAEEKRHVVLLRADVNAAAGTLAAGEGVHPS
jgi:rubrerythrin